MTTIAYDRKVHDFIAALDATGHVTHTKHRKTKVTLHHNGGRLSLQGILEVWKIRPASAHFQVDGNGATGQYVRVNEYAWSTGTTVGNQESISIEMANSSLGPDWNVATVTWAEAARLAGWLFARVIGERPTRETLVVHKRWKPTICAGPYIDGVYDRILQIAQQSYDYFKGGQSTQPTVPSAPMQTGKSIGDLAAEVIDGKWGNNPERAQRLSGAGYNASAVQAEVNRQLSGGRRPSGSKSVSDLAAEVIEGRWGYDPIRRQRLTEAGYDAAAVQNEVNRRLGSASGQRSSYAMAREVIDGKWGNGEERRRRLTEAGYNFQLIQNEVNRQIRAGR